MSKLETAEQFVFLMKEGKYENKVNAKRAAGRTRLVDSEKKKAFAAIEVHFGADDAETVKAPKKTGKKAKKKTAKKMALQAAQTPSTGTVPMPPQPSPKKVGGPTKKKVAKKAKKKATAQAKSPAGSLAISPSQVETVADVLKIIDSTVGRSVSILNALARADEINKAGEISEGVKVVKQALVGAAQLLQDSVVAPLRHAGNQADAETAYRLEQVVNASQTPLQELVPPMGNVMAPHPSTGNQSS